MPKAITGVVGGDRFSGVVADDAAGRMRYLPTLVCRTGRGWYPLCSLFNFYIALADADTVVHFPGQRTGVFVGDLGVKIEADTSVKNSPAVLFDAWMELVETRRNRRSRVTDARLSL